jgi:hypothetical protein
MRKRASPRIIRAYASAARSRGSASTIGRTFCSTLNASVSEPQGEFLFVTAALDHGHAHAHCARKLYAQMAETADALDGYQIPGPSG